MRLYLRPRVGQRGHFVAAAGAARPLYNSLSMRRSFGQALKILLAFGLAILVSVLGLGLWSAHEGTEAVRAGEHLAAAHAFEAAARLLPWRSDLRETAGIAFFEAGDPANAVRLLQTCRARNALSPHGWEVLGAATWAGGDQTGAIVAWQDALEHYPLEPSMLDYLADAYRELGHYSDEQEALERRLLIQVDPEAHYRLGLLLMFSYPSAAAAQLDDATALNPDVGEAATTLKETLRAADVEANEASRMIVIGRGLGLVQEWPLAARAFRLAVNADERNADGHAWLAEALQQIGEDGYSEIQAALALDPQSTTGHVLAGMYWRRQGKTGLSLAEYSQAAALEPEDGQLQSLLGDAHAANGDLAAAIEAYQRGADLAPQEPEQWRRLAMFSADNAVLVLEVGLPAAEKAVELAPNDARSLDALGWVNAQAGYLFKAEEALLEAIRNNPDSASAQLHLGITYLRRGQNDLAYEHLMRAVALDGEGAIGLQASQLLKAARPAN